MPNEQINNKQAKIEQSKDLAGKYMRDGWGSRGSVFHAIYDVFDTGISQEEFRRICAVIDPFHAPASSLYEDGHGFSITTCGALSGALASFALIHGFQYGLDFPGNFGRDIYQEIMTNPDLCAKEKTEQFMDKLNSSGYGAYYQIVARFRARLGTTDCFELRKPYCKGDPLSKEAFKICKTAAIEAAGIAAEIILEYEEDPNSLQIGKGNVHMVELQ